MIAILWVHLGLIIPAARVMYGRLRLKMTPSKCRCRHFGHEHYLECYETDPMTGWTQIIAVSILWPLAAVGYGIYRFITFRPKMTIDEKLTIKAAELKAVEKKTAEAEAELAKVTYELKCKGIKY